MIRLTDEQWERIRDHFPEENIADGRPGRKPTPTRCVLEAVLWILNTGAQWHMLPQSYPNYKTVHRRFQTWCRDEVLRRVLTDVANELRDRGALNEEECFIDATFVMAGGGLEIGATKRGKGMKIMAIVDRHGLPLSVSTHAAKPSRSAFGFEPSEPWSTTYRISSVGRERPWLKLIIRRPMHQNSAMREGATEDGRAYDATHVRTASRLISDGKV